MNNNAHNNTISSISILITSLIFTKNCYTISAGVISLLSLFIYLINHSQSTADFGEFTLSRLEGEDTSYWLMIWLITFIVLILLWNFYLFIFNSVFKYQYSQSNDTVSSSLAEDLYKNPFFYLITIYHLNMKYVENAIDNSQWFFISVNYYFLSFFLIQYFINIDKEIASITNYSSDMAKAMLPKIRKIGVYFLVIDCLFSLFVYLITIEIDFVFQCIILGKGVYLVIKTIELWVTRRNEMRFIQLEMNVKEKYLISNLKAKTFLGLIKMACIFYQLVAIYIYSESQPFYFTVLSFGIILIQGYQGLLFYKKYENLKEYYRELDNSLTKKNSIDEECVICTEKLKNARVLTCNHFFHLICLSKWFEKGHKTCPVCRNEISIQESPGLVHPHRNQRRVLTVGLRLNASIFSWLPNISMRIIRTGNHTVTTGDNNINLI